MPFENFPYSDFHGLNLDWLLQKVKELEDGSGSGAADSILKLKNVTKCLDSGPGGLTIKVTNATGMTMGAESWCYREKANSAMLCYIRLTNNTGSTVAADTTLVTLGDWSVDDTILLRGIAGTVYHSDNTVTTALPTLFQDTVLEKASIKFENAIIPDGSYVIITGYAPVSATTSPLLARGQYDELLAMRICHAFLHGYNGYSWAPGDFTYSQNAATRLDPSQRATDCSGMVYLAYGSEGLSPGRGSGSDPYWADGIVLAYADVNEDLDVSNALPGDVITYAFANDPRDMTHCTLYAGGDVCYENAYTYPAAEQAAGCVNGQGPYAIPTPASKYRKDRIRYLVRFL